MKKLSPAASPNSAGATAQVRIDLIPPNTDFEDRIQQVDLRLTRNLPLGKSRKLQGNFDIYNILNASTVQNEQSVYSNTNNQWRNAIQIMGGRLIKFSAQLTF